MTDKAPQITTDERIEALLIGAEQQAELAKTQGDTVAELVATLEGITAQIAKDNATNQDNATEQYKQLLLRLETLSNKVVTENTLTKNEIINIIANTVNSYFVKNLATSLSDETKKHIQTALNDVVGGLISKAVDKDISSLKAEIQQIKQELRDTANDTQQIALEVNQRLKVGADEIVGEGVEQILQGVKGATASYQSTVANLEKVATLSTKKAQPIFDELESVGDLLRGKLFWFTGLFCVVWFLVSMLIAFILYQINVPSKDEIASRLNTISQLDMSIKSMNAQLSTLNYEYKDGKTYVTVDRGDCHDSFGKNFCLKK